MASEASTEGETAGLIHGKLSEAGALPDVIEHRVKVRIVIDKFVIVHPVTGQEIEVAPLQLQGSTAPGR